MKHAAYQLWRRNKFALAAFVVAAAVTTFFALRLVFFWAYWSDPAHRNQPIEGWMTPGYIAYSNHVPKDAVARTLGLKPDGHAHLTLEDIAAQSGRDVDELVLMLNAMIAAKRQTGE